MFNYLKYHYVFLLFFFYYYYLLFFLCCLLQVSIELSGTLCLQKQIVYIPFRTFQKEYSELSYFVVS